MSERARIGILINKKQVKFIRNIIDGGPAVLGKALKENYNTPQKVEQLIEHGDCIYPGDPKISRVYETWHNVKPKIVDLDSFEKSQFDDYRYIYNPVTNTWKCKHISDFKFKRIK